MGNAFDTANAPTIEPTEITAGDYISWKRTDLGTDYPNSAYTLSYQARKEGAPARQITINASADGTDYLVEIASTVSKDYDAGRWHWTAYITRISDSARVSVGSGVFDVLANKATDSSDPRSLAERMVAKIEAALEGRADNEQLDVLAYSLGVDVSATRDPAKLLEHLGFWYTRRNMEKRRARARKGQSHGGVIKAKF